MTNDRELSILAAYVAEILEQSEGYGVIEGLKRITPPDGLRETLKDCRTDERGWSGRDIFARLYRLNERAYCSRYKDATPGELPDYQHPTILYTEANISEWLPRLYFLLKFFCYQTLEDDTESDPLRLALETLRARVAFVISDGIAEDRGCKWGRW